MEEGLRRLRNCSPDLDWRDKVEFLNRFASDLKRSGHATSFRRTILKRIILKYKTDLSNHVEGIKPLYRTRVEREHQNLSCSKERHTWFRSSGATSTLTVPTTPGGTLADEVRRNLDRSRQPEGTKTKVIEDGGVSSRVGLVKTNQFPRLDCHRDDCVLCLQRVGEAQMSGCMLNSVSYEGQCTRCQDAQVYVGETSRAAYTRINEHMDNYRAASKAKLPALVQSENSVMCGKTRCVEQNKCKCAVKSWMWEHTRDIHNGVVSEDMGLSDYRMKVTKKFEKCLYRQVFEDIRMQHCVRKGGSLLNSKNEYYTPKSVQAVFKQW